MAIKTRETTATGVTNKGSPLTNAELDNNFVELVANKVDLTDLSVTTNSAGTAALSYNNSSGVFTYTPPDLSGYLTSFTETNDLTASVTWANVPNANITEASVTQHQAALAVTASQISDVTATAAELNLVDGSAADTVVNSKAVVYGSAGQITANELDVDNIQIDANAVKSTNTNGNIQLFPNGTGYTELYGNTNAGAIRFNCESNSHGVTLKGPPHSAGATYSLELPDADGSSGQALVTNGSGKLSFSNVDALPSQSGNSGYYLTTDGSSASWNNLKASPTFTGIVTFSGTDAVTLPVGTTAQRPTAAQGMLRYNTTTAGFEGYSGSAWSSLGAQFAYTRTSATATASQTTFSVSYTAGYVDVYLNGVKLVSGTDFTATNGTSVVLATGATVGDSVEIIAFEPFAIADALAITNNLSDLSSASTAITNLGITATAAELNILDGVTATTAELNYVDGVTSNIQTQIDNINPSPSLTATASGTLANGDTVIVNSDGTVSAVSVGSVSQSVGTSAVFESANVEQVAAVYDANAQKVVIAYRDNGNSHYGTAIVGTVSGTSISFGTPTVFESATVRYMAIAYDANAQKVVIVYRDYGNSSQGTGIVGTVSGTSISFGSAVVYESGSVDHQSAAYDANAQKVVISYQDGGNSNYGTAVVGTVSGTSISFGTPVVFESAATVYTSTVYDASAQKVVIAYRDDGNNDYGTAIVGTVSGTSISFGTAAVYESAGVEHVAAAYDASAEKVVIAYRDRDNNDYGTAIVGTVSGTGISFGSAVVFESASTSEISAVYAANSQKVVIAYRDGGNSNKGTAIVGTVSGTSISFGSATIFEAGDTEFIAAVYHTDAKNVVMAYRDGSNSDYGTGVVFQNAYSGTNLTAENYIGISDAAYSDGATATIQIVGSVDDAQSSLTAGQQYFVQTDRSLGLAAATPSVFAGTAVSATKIIVKG